MEHFQLEPGKVYAVKVSGIWRPCRFVEHTEHGGITRTFRDCLGLTHSRHDNLTHRYHFINLVSGRAVVVKSYQKIRQLSAE